MRLKIILVTVPLLLLITLLVFIPFKQTLAFTYENEEKLLAYLPFEKENSFQIKYTHSIHLSDVIETYKLTKKQIILTELSYKDFAIGMPSNAEGDEVFEEKNGTYYIKNMNRSFPFVDLRLGQVRADHRIIYKDHTYTLSNFIEPGTWVRMSPEKMSLWELLKGVNISG
ncbi:DUF1850 domain-containing protein [Metabacillus endolithicus]|uniref:DUF1850 domain-containing protein n=1 Tax=Metabacillus endolithicus TaxID=1535204 RepID=A0ABW5BQZ3_9BACI|nr:DUF1850 domain-containing protein [Metabacillus endolithicus]UPG63508.1 DUF1850 domain-containing protein [Metabacillus endolithicus]